MIVTRVSLAFEVGVDRDISKLIEFRNIVVNNSKGNLEVKNTKRKVLESVIKVSIVMAQVVDEAQSFKEIFQSFLINTQKMGTHRGLILPTLKMIELFVASNNLVGANLLSPVVNSLDKEMGSFLTTKM